MALIRTPVIAGDCFTVSSAARSGGVLLAGGIGLVSVGAAVLTALPWLALGLPLALVGCLLVLLKALTDMVIIGESAVMVRQGLIIADTHVRALAHLRVRVHQSILGRLLNMGTIILSDGKQSTRVTYLGDIDRLVTVLIERMGASRILLDHRRGRP